MSDLDEVLYLPNKPALLAAFLAVVVIVIATFSNLSHTVRRCLLVLAASIFVLALWSRHPAPSFTMTEAQARAILRGRETADSLEAWLADQPWQRLGFGWTFSKEDGWRFEIVPLAGAVRVTASAPGDEKPAVWTVTK